MKAERVQLWQRVIDAGRSLADRIRNVLGWIVAAAGAITSFLDSRDKSGKS